MSAPGGRHAAVERPERPPGRPVDIGDPGRAAATVVPRPDGRFPFHNDIVADAARVPGPAGGELHLLAASVRGLSHLYYGKVRQDAFGHLVTRDGRWLVAAVADGVSAGSHSHVAAEIVTRLGCRLLVEQLDDRPAAELDWRAVLDGVGGEIVRHARQRLGLVDSTLPDVAGRLAATALFAVVAVDPAETGDRPVHVMSLGDTSAWVLRPGAPPAWDPLQAVKNDGSVVASAATMALPGVPVELAPPVTTSLTPGEALVLMSDGVGDPLGGGTGEVGEYLAGAWREPPDPFTFIAQVGFRRRTYDDDRTVLAVWPVQ
ncbi:protein phosphatase 2C domain-containing protein [Actinophytocola gossypii]|uniref:Protein phosphatase 2C domain-containing protein n=1 Tax=Actinophytocola gossypii TaxID=2812003 RepID=A0ABT2JK55_9PSEU|nr:protein phosphatase 2C domain-containing protein [Actinophytocola gossypii]MCT2588267.1 protein phosphatase 2C domain-containing protein [Actinophytocola gossypii]